MTSSFAVIVCSRDRPEQLAEALAHIAKALRPEDERVVVDSASTDAAAVAAVADAAGFRLVRCELPGLSRARNAGWAATSAAMVAYTDDDCRPEPGWVDRLSDALAVDHVGFVTGSVRADRETRLPLAVSAPGTDRRTFEYGDDPLRCGHGANIAFRREAVDEVGGFDEALGAGSRLRAGEDSDMFWRLMAAGWRGVHEPDAAVTHVQWRTTAAALKISWGYGLGLGAMAVKGIRARRRDGWAVLLRRGLWEGGLLRAWRDLRNGYQTGVVSALVRVVGVVMGAVYAVRLPIRNDRFA